MKKKLFIAAAFFLSVSTVLVAQTSVTPEVPRNYKPQARELLPMPGELTDQMIFPVLGRYEYVSEEGSMPTRVTVTRDPDNKGVVWINGLPQGRFKADLKLSPATYKIPVQKTQINLSEEELLALTDSAVTATASETKSKIRYSGKSLKEGTLLFDSASNKLYVNVGDRFNEDEPASVFPELEMTNDEMVTDEGATASATTSKQQSKKKKSPAGTKYVLAKVVEVAAVQNNNGW